MLVVPTELRSSPIHGVGVFLLKPLKKGELIWRFDARIDRVYSQAEFDTMPQPAREFLDTYGCWQEDNGLLLVCGDYASYLNHDENPTNLSVGGIFSDDVASRDLEAGTELTANYKLICDYVKKTGKFREI